MPDEEALLVVIDIEGDERSTRQQAFLEVLLADRGDAAEKTSVIFSVARFFKRERCCGSRGGARRPASGLARPHAHAELSRAVPALTVRGRV